MRKKTIRHTSSGFSTAVTAFNQMRAASGYHSGGILQFGDLF